MFCDPNLNCIHSAGLDKGARLKVIDWLSKSIFQIICFRRYDVLKKTADEISGETGNQVFIDRKSLIFSFFKLLFNSLHHIPTEIKRI